MSSQAPRARIPGWIRIPAKFLFDLVELYIPMATFTAMFLLFLLNVFFRYVLNNPLTWPFELTVLTFIWTAVLGATFTRRQYMHVKFTLLYDRSSPKGRLFTRLAGNALIAVIFGISLYPSFDYVQFMAFQKTTVLRIPFNIAYFPYVVFLVLIIAHCVYDIVIDLRRLSKREYAE